MAVQLDGLAREQEENEGSSVEESGPSSEGSGSLPGMQGIFLKQSARELEMVTAINGGVQQGRKLSWSFTGGLSVPYGNKRGPNDPATVADKSTEVALMRGYHTTVTPWIVGDQEAREILGLTKEDSEQVLVLRDCILRHCFRELDTIDDDEWQNQMSCALKWQEHASRMRLLQSSKEVDLQNVELPTESRGGEDWLRPSHPLNDERELGEQDEVTYAIAARVPACALWNLLDYSDEDGVPLMTVVEWLRFIQARSQVDQDLMQAVIARVLLRALWMYKVCQGMFFG